MIKKLLLLLFFSILTTTTIAFGYPIVSQNGSYVTVINDTGTGTTLNELATFSGSNPSAAVKASIGASSGILGVVVAGAGTTGSALIETSGFANCVFDGATTAGDYVIPSATVAGECHDNGASSGSTSIGQVSSTNGASGTYTLLLYAAATSGGAVPINLAPAQTGTYNAQGFRISNLGVPAALGDALSEGHAIGAVSPIPYIFLQPTVVTTVSTATQSVDPTTGRNFVYQLAGSLGSGSTVTFNLPAVPCTIGPPDIRISVVQDGTNGNHVVAWGPGGGIVWQNTSGGAAPTALTGLNARTDYAFYCDAVSGNWVNDNVQTSTVQPQPPGIGGTGLSSPTAHDLVVAEGTSSAFNLVSMSAGNLLFGQGASVDPASHALSGDATVTSGGVATVTKTNTVPLDGDLGHLSGTVPVEVTNTVAETTIFSATLPGNFLGNYGCVRAEIFGDNLYNNANTDTLTFKLEKGAASVFATTGAQTLAATSASRDGIRAVLWFCNQGTSGASATQAGQGALSWKTSQTFGAIGTKSVDESANITLSVTATWGATSTNDDLKIYGANMVAMP